MLLMVPTTMIALFIMTASTYFIVSGVPVLLELYLAVISVISMAMGTYFIVTGMAPVAKCSYCNAIVASSLTLDCRHCGGRMERL